MTYLKHGIWGVILLLVACGTDGLVWTLPQERLDKLEGRTLLIRFHDADAAWTACQGRTPVPANACVFMSFKSGPYDCVIDTPANRVLLTHEMALCAENLKGYSNIKETTE